MSYEDLKLILNATYQQSPINAPVINKQTIEPHIWVRLPTEISKYFALYQIDEVSKDVVPVDYTSYIEIESCKPWIRFDKDMFNLSIGLHTYRLSFVNKQNNDTISLYVSYQLQDNSPDKPYIYMNR